MIFFFFYLTLIAILFIYFVRFICLLLLRISREIATTITELQLILKTHKVKLNFDFKIIKTLLNAEN